MKGRSALFVLVATVAVASVLAIMGGLGMPALESSLSCLGHPGQSRTFTIVISADGFNDSRAVAGLGIWPTFGVSRCDSVTLKFVNTNNSFHELAVETYAARPSSLEAGQTLSISFLAYKVGQFRVYCTHICIVHDYIQNSQLTVI